MKKLILLIFCLVLAAPCYAQTRSPCKPLILNQLEANSIEARSPLKPWYQDPNTVIVDKDGNTYDVYTTREPKTGTLPQWEDNKIYLRREK